MTTPDFNQVYGVSQKLGGGALSVDDPFRALVILVFVTLIIERALTAVYETGLWSVIKKPFNRLGITGMKLYTAIVVNVAIAFVVHLDAFALMTSTPATTLGMLITGLFCSGGAKAWADIYRQMNSIQESKIRAANGTK